MADFKLDEMEPGSSGIDAFLRSEPKTQGSLAQKLAAKQPRVRVASLAQLTGFDRISSETLIHKSTQDLWGLTREGGDLYIQRLVSDENGPLKD